MLELPKFEYRRFEEQNLPLHDWTKRPNVLGKNSVRANLNAAVNPKLVRLAKAGKVTLLPHMGSATIEGRVEMGEKVIINIRTFLDNHKPPDRVLPSML